VLWREIEAGGQADLFGASGARHRGGGPGPKPARPVAVLRPGVLREVECGNASNSAPTLPWD